MEPLRPSPDELNAPRIPRFRTLVITVKLSTIALLLLFVIRLIWGHTAQRQIETRLAQYRARGESTHTSDFNPPPIPDEQNAAFYILRAAKVMTKPQDKDYLVHWLQPTDPCPPEIERLARNWIAANQQSLQDTEAGLNCSRAVWQTDRTCRETLVQGTDAIINLISLLITTSTIDLKDGNYERCLTRIEEEIRVNQSLRSQPLWLAQLTVSRLYIGLGNQISQVLPSLRLAQEGNPTPPAPGASMHIPASRAQVVRLIALLCDEAPDEAANLNALYAERAFIDEWTSATAAGELWKYRFGDRKKSSWWERASWSRMRASWYWVAPSVKSYAASELDYYTMLINAAHVSNSAAMHSIRHQNRHSFDTSIGVYPVNILEAGLDIANFHGWYPIEDRVLFARRRTAVLLAARLYQSDHGIAPANLAQLVPVYLNQIPLNPATGAAGTWSLAPPQPPPTTAPASRPPKQ